MTDKIENKHSRRRRRRKRSKTNQKLKRQLCGDKCFMTCYYCKFVFLVDEMTVEHITPLSFNGTNDLSNVTMACYECNHSRGKETEKILKSQYNVLFQEMVRYLNVSREEALTSLL
jgi:5-methylcytosine-specific restriction endonuclease McrA